MRVVLPAVCAALCAACSTTATDSGNAPAGNAPLPSTHFDRVLLLETSSETSANVSIGDVNGDGHLDLVLAKGRHWPLVDRVLLGDGTGGITSASNLGDQPDRTYSGLLVDVDADGDLDVVISNDTPDATRVHLNDGGGRFRAGATLGRAAWETRNATAADVNADGLPDIVVANRPTITDGRPMSEASNYICLNRGGGNFVDQCVAFSREPATTITAADFNQDGLVDLAVPYRDRGQSYVYLNRGNMTFTRAMPFGSPDARFRAAVAVDLDRNGLLDLVAIDEARGVLAHFGQRDGTFSPAVAIEDGSVTPYAIASHDLDADGHIDLIVGHVEGPSTAYFNDGSGRKYTPVTFGDAQGTVYGFAVGDLNEDGRPDIAAARSDAPNIVYFGSAP